MAFLHGTPKSWKETRLQYACKKGRAVEMPPVAAGAYLIDVMWKLGPVRADVNGTRGVDWTELDAFARLTRAISEPWEAEALHAMCDGYAAEQAKAEDSLRDPPLAGSWWF